jgi:hypothetical protein
MLRSLESLADNRSLTIVGQQRRCNWSASDGAEGSYDVSE